MEYTCQHCGANLDEGDVFEHFLLRYGGDYIRAREAANSYGWTERIVYILIGLLS